MTSQFAPQTTSEISRSSTGSGIQAIDAHYYNITDTESWPVAGLLVLLDGRQRPVRAELHLYEELPSHIQEGAVRQSRMVLQEHYAGGDPVPLRILTTHQMREAMDVRLPAEAVRMTAPQSRRWWGMGAAVAGVAAVVLLVWSLISFLRPATEGEGEIVAGVPQGPVQDTALNAAVQEPVDNGSAEEGALLVEPPTAAGASVAGSGLPPSRNAHRDLGIGVRVEIVPGLRLALRSEPGADAGTEVGYMADGAEAQIVGGPHMTQGDSDTIVWWYVQLDNGMQAWAAANTSQQTLLVPAQ